jgi:hypothetical protein
MQIWVAQMATYFLKYEVILCLGKYGTGSVSISANSSSSKCSFIFTKFPYFMHVIWHC